MGASGSLGNGRAGRLGNQGWQPVTRLNGVRKVAALGVNLINAKADARWLLQYDRGSLVKPLRMVSFKVRMARSTCPLALLLPMVILWWAILVGYIGGLCLMRRITVVDFLGTPNHCRSGYTWAYPRPY